MKKILLTCAVAMSIFAADAQQSKTGKKSKKAKVNTEAVAKAKYAKLEEERQQRFEDERVARLTADSTRKENDRLAEEKFQAERVAWKEMKEKELDSTYHEKYVKIEQDRETWSKDEMAKNQVISAAKLSETQGRQVKVVNDTYTEKAKAIRDNVDLTDDQKKEQFVALNTERKAKLKAVLGNSKAKKFDKERKEFVQKNGASADQAWIDEAEGYVKN
jgi:hypothetical protein